MKRTSCVRFLTVESITQSSAFQCGDTGWIRARSFLSRTEAEEPAQEAESDPTEGEAYPRSAPQVEAAAGAVTLRINNDASSIAVNRIRVLSLEGASLLLTGSNIRLELEAAERKVRVLPPPKDGSP